MTACRYLVPICLLFAVRQEMLPLARRLRLSPARLGSYSAFSGRAGNTDLLLLTTGVGRRCAARAAERVISEWSPELLAMTGVAGALSPDLAVGDLVLGTEIRTEGGTLVPSAQLGAANGLRQGPLLSLDRVLLTAAEKRSSAGKPPALAVEMETAGVAEVANARGIPWAAVRAISDACDEALPLDFNRLRTPDGDLPTARVALAAVMRPACIPGLVRLGRNMSLAAERLADYWAEALSQEPGGWS